LSRELAANHDVIAVDANAGPHGLSAVPVAQRCFFAVQAEIERLPLADRSIDLAIASASLHYVSNVEAVLDTLSRILRPDGRMMVLDSPVYATRDAVEAACERTRAYYAQAGFPELAEHYRGLLNAVFLQSPNFRFSCLRRDFSTEMLLKKRWQEFKGLPGAARFPIWLGEQRIVQTEAARETTRIR
jgi:ubiquinone/menaquinone biosynthesis C-methylase UbiE